MLRSYYKDLTVKIAKPMVNCLNCKAVLSCSCKKKTATDGTSCCDKCIKSYERSLVSQKRYNLGIDKSITPGSNS